VLKINVYYWKEKVPGSYNIQGRFPCFLQAEYPEGKEHIYGLPSNEYPGLMKVRLRVKHWVTSSLEGAVGKT